MKRRDFLKSTATITGAGLLAGYKTKAQSNTGPAAVPGPQPNILLILVDELRYPTVFPDGIKGPADFLAKFMPNVYKLWEHGVKFGNYHTAANACTPSRGVMITGLYSQQNWLLTTILSTPYPPGQRPTRQPVLNSAYPTFGKLLRDVGYQTPYTGKWHVSVPQADKGGLEDYGFDFFTYYDPTGDNLQGTYGDEIRGYHNDSYSAGQGVDWLLNKRPQNGPWCLTVSLVNPHDREFFPAGTEFKTVTDLFADKNVNPKGLDQMAHYPGTGPDVAWQENALKRPPSYKYPDLPPNWENADAISKKPSTQTFVKEFQQGIWGGIADDPSQDTATIEQYPNRNAAVDLNFGVVKMPFSYWKRGLDSYTQVMQIVDNDIGGLLDAFNTLPKDVIENTVIVFAADHGEYSGAHGLVQGKLGTVYEEAWHIPLIVVDPSGRFTGDTQVIRNGLTSSVDLMNLLVSIGNKGTKDWMQGYLADIYGDRHDMVSMLKSNAAPGREYVLFATDEIVPNYFNFNRAPTHVLGWRHEATKLGVYEKWLPPTSKIIPGSIELEFYDYSTTGGQLEIDDIASHDPRAYKMSQTLLHDIVPNELQAILPAPLTGVQSLSKKAHLLYREFIALQPSGAWKNGGLGSILGYGRNF